MAKQQPPKSPPKSPPKLPPELPKPDTKGYKDLADFSKKFLEDQKQQAINSADLNKLAEELAGSWGDVSNAIKAVSKYSGKLGENFSDVEDLTKTLVKNLENVGGELYEQLNVTDKIKELQESQNKKLGQYSKLKAANRKFTKENLSLEEELSNLIAERTKEQKGFGVFENESFKNSKKQIEDAIKLNNEKIESNKLSYETLRTEQAINASRIISLSAIEDIGNALDIANKKAKEQGIDIAEISKDLSEPFEKVLGYLDKVPGGGILKNFLGVDKKLEVVSTAITQSFISGLATSGSVGTAAFGALSTGAATFMATLGPILVPLLAIAAVLAGFQRGMEIDQEISDFGKAMGVSREEASGVHHEMESIAIETKVIGANTKELYGAYQELAKSIGVTKLANADMAESQVLLKNQMGMTADEASEFQKLSMMTGKTSEQNLAIIQAGVQASTGGLMNYKDAAKDIAGTSKKIQAGYKNDIKALTKAVVQAKKLGMTMEDTAGVSKNLLSIEESLENEMKANVLTGKHMNMNTARQLALQGKSAEAAAEAVKQAGDYNDIIAMAPYQLEATAAAAGMTADQLLKSAETSKMFNDIAAETGVQLDENGSLTDEQLEKAASLGNEAAKKLVTDKQSASAQEKLAALGDKLLALFDELMSGPLGEMMSVLGDMATKVFPVLGFALETAFAPLKWTWKLLSAIWDIIGGPIMESFDAIGEAVESIKKPFNDLFSTFSSGEGSGFMKVLKDIGSIIIDNIFMPFKITIGFITGAIKAIGQVVGHFIEDYLGSLMDIFGGIKKIFSGDIMEGLKQLGGGIMDYLLAPFKAVGNIIVGLLNAIISGINAISITVPDWVPAIGGQTFGFDIPEIPYLAKGGTIGKEGIAVVGEEGPEIASLPAGATVTSNSDSGGVLSKLGEAANSMTGGVAGGLGELTNSLMSTLTSNSEGGGSAPAQDNSEMVNILKQILAATSQPVSINIGGKVIDEIEKQTTLRKTYNTKMDSAHGAF
jgi:hypothetical protein